MIVVSGASRGIGNAIYQSLKNQDKEVIGFSKSLNDDPNIFQCDISDYSSVQDLVSKIKKKT